MALAQGNGRSFAHLIGFLAGILHPVSDGEKFGKTKLHTSMLLWCEVCHIALCIPGKFERDRLSDGGVGCKRILDANDAE